VTHLGLVLVSFVLSLVSSATTEIEGAFRRNDPERLRPLLEKGSFLNISFSSPDVFSDLLSDEQTLLWLRGFFRSSRTLGFYPEGPAVQSLENGSFVFKARWEVRTRDGRQTAYDILFLIRSASFHPPGSRAPGRGFWKILQIRAERR